MNEVAAIIPNEWRQVGLQLGLTENELDCISIATHERPLNCFSSVFHYWKDKTTKPFTWEALIQVLEAPAIAEMRLAKKLRNKLT